jgi:polyribonucleotide nucleotidyltransferase
MSEQVNEKELVDYIAQETEIDPQKIKLVLKHEQAYINAAEEDARGEVNIDSDDLVDYIMSRPDMKLDELTVETILDTEMEYLMEKGIAGYDD